LRGENRGSGIVERELPHEEPDFRESGNHICFYISLDSHEKTNPDLFFWGNQVADQERTNREQ
jgi:hypothetical protein